MSDTTSAIFKASSNQTLGALRSIVLKSEAHARALKVEDDVMLAARLFPDMLGATRQVQIACDTVARGAARLAGLDMPSFPDTEKTFAELAARCESALAFVNGVADAKIDANENVTLQIPMGPQTIPMTGRDYLSGFILPNLHFHAAIFYGLMRTQGVVLGKRDFLMPG